MSSSILYTLNQRSVTQYDEYKNGWGSAPLCWDYLALKYLPLVNFTNYDRPDYVGIERKFRMVWDLAGSDQLDTCEKLALMLTFDKAFVPKAHLMEVGMALKEFYLLTKEEERLSKHVNHWDDIGVSLITMAEEKLHNRARGACLTCTTVNDAWAHDKTWPQNAWPILGGD